MVRDPYTSAKNGEVQLTLNYLWNFGIVPRTDNYRRLKFVSLGRRVLRLRNRTELEYRQRGRSAWRVRFHTPSLRPCQTVGGGGRNPSRQGPSGTQWTMTHGRLTCYAVTTSTVRSHLSKAEHWTLTTLLKGSVSRLGIFQRKQDNRRG